jgi:hypothetical protein
MTTNLLERMRLVVERANLDPRRTDSDRAISIDLAAYDELCNLIDDALEPLDAEKETADDRH